MGRSSRQTREAARQDLIRLLDGLDYYRSWRIASVQRDKGMVTQEDLNQIVMPGSFFLQAFEETSDRQMRGVVDEVRQWYAHTASDLTYLARIEGEAEIQAFLADFRKDMGFDFFSESGLVKKTADKALKQNKIANDKAYYILKELETDLSQTILTDPQMTEISDLLRAYEARKRPG